MSCTSSKTDGSLKVTWAHLSSLRLVSPYTRRRKKKHVPHTSRLPKELTLMASVLLEGGVARHQAGIHSHSEGLHNAAIRVLMHEGCKWREWVVVLSSQKSVIAVQRLICFKSRIIRHRGHGDLGKRSCISFLLETSNWWCRDESRWQLYDRVRNISVNSWLCVWMKWAHGGGTHF